MVNWLNIVCGNQPPIAKWVSLLSMLDYQSSDTTGMAFGENLANEMLLSYKGHIGADHYCGYCSVANPVERSFLQVDFKREVLIEQVETQGLASYYAKAWHQS